MRYIIVVWTSELELGKSPTWVIKHYSHTYKDAFYWYEKFSKIYPTIHLLVDAFAVKEKEKKEELFNFLDSFINKVKESKK